MTWTKLSDTWTDQPELLELSRSTRLLAVEALVWCNRHLTDGVIVRAALPRLTDHENPQAGADELVAAGVWSETATGWVADWADQETSETVGKRRKATKLRTARWRGQKVSDGVTDGVTDGVGNAAHAGDAVTNRVTNGVGNALPVPSRPDPKGGTGTGTGDSGEGGPRPPAGPLPLAPGTSKGNKYPDWLQIIDHGKQP